jgi:hypothetical protein
VEAPKKVLRVLVASTPPAVLNSRSETFTASSTRVLLLPTMVSGGMKPPALTWLRPTKEVVTAARAPDSVGSGNACAG